MFAKTFFFQNLFAFFLSLLPVDNSALGSTYGRFPPNLLGKIHKKIVYLILQIVLVLYRVNA